MFFRRNKTNSREPLMGPETNIAKDGQNTVSQTNYGTTQTEPSILANDKQTEISNEATTTLIEGEGAHYSYPPTSAVKRGSYGYSAVSRNGSDEDLQRLKANQSPSLPTPSLSPTEQTLSLQADDLELTLVGYNDIKTRVLIYNGVGILTVGITLLLGRWLPSIPTKLTAQFAPFLKADWILIKNQFDELEKCEILEVPYGGTYQHIFGDHGQRVKDDIHDDAHYKTYRQSILASVKLVRYRFLTFLLDPVTGCFQPLSEWQDFRWENLSTCHSGLDTGVLKERDSVFQSNVIDIPKKSIPKLLIDEVLHPFYIFQVFSIILWCFENYFIYAGSIFVISLFSIIATLIQTHTNWVQIREMAKYVCNVRVYRQRHWTTIPSEELVPGDIYEISDPDFVTFPCDSVLIQGDCIVGEGMLTGESIPISKVPLTEAERLFAEFGTNMTSMNNFSPELSSSLLFSGTHVIRVRGGPIPPEMHPDRERDRRAVAMVLRTGFNTAKGSLIRSILFPRPNIFQFYRDSFYFIGVMGFLAVIGFAFSLVNLIGLGMSTFLIVVRALDIVTIVVPPALPATMSVGMQFAVTRLKANDIFCIAPSRINVCGKIDIMCFDKTGTLTEEGLDVLGSQEAENGRLSELENVTASLTNVKENSKLCLLHCLATCHSIKVVDDELLGDPLDLKMFEATGWTLEEGGSTHAASQAQQDKRHSTQFIPSMVRPPNQARFSIDNIMEHSPPEDYLELGILRSFEFVSSLRRMSVIVKKLRSQTTEVYVKGAPEAIKDLCDPKSVPSDYFQQLKEYTQQGYRVIACAGKSETNLPFIKVHKATRDQIESNLTFLGFIVFENKLKPGTIPALNILQDANIRQVMCTGDNQLTAISVAKQCTIIEEKALVFIPRIEEYSHQIVWNSVNHSEFGIDEANPVMLDNVTLAPPQKYIKNYAIAVTGDCFKAILESATTGVIHRMLVKAQVYARMSPEEKQELVEMLQTIDYCVGFCGDGANDCGALKAADVGLSLSEAEASIAAPFTSKSPDISCVPLVIREGRAALVTSFSCFKYMGLYSIIQFASIILLYNYGSNLGDYQFLLFDLFVIMPVAVAMARTLPHPKLYFKPPTASLVSTNMLVSFIGQCFLQIVFQVIVFLYVTKQSWFEEPEFDPEEPNIESQINTALFLISSYQYLWGAIVFSVGFPYRKELYTNIPFVFTLVILLAFMIWNNLSPMDWQNTVLQLVDIPMDFRWLMLGIGFANLVTSYLYEQYVAVFIVFLIHGVKSIFRKLSNKSRSSPSNSGSTTPTVVDDQTINKSNRYHLTKQFEIVQYQMDFETKRSA